MKKYVPLSLHLVFALTAFSQKELPEFGKINLSDLQLKACPLEPEAPAMKIFDVTEAEFEYGPFGSKIKTEKRVRIKIFKESGYPFAAIRIPYFSKKQVSKIKDLKGAVYNLDEAGNLVTQKLEKKEFFRNQTDDNLGIINFTFPNLRPGSVLEFSYTRIENDVFQLDAWEVQDHIPSLYTANIIVIPTESRIREKFFGIDTIEQRVQKISGKREMYTYFKENVPSFHSEPYMTSFRDNLLRVTYLLIPESNQLIDSLTAPDKTWEIAGRQLLYSRFFRGQMTTDIPGTDTLIEMAKKIQPVAGRVAFLFEAVKKQSPDKAEQATIPADVAEAWKNKTGSTAELNLILINLLRKANVQCYPLLVSTRSHGKIITAFPSTSQFNGLDVLAVDSEKVYILDASVRLQSYSTPPANVLNRIALLLNEQQIRWIQIEDERPLLKQDVAVQACLNQDGNLLGHAAITSYDYAKMAILDSAANENDEDKINKADELKIYTRQFAQTANDDDPLKQAVAFQYTSQKTGGFYFIKPQFFTSLRKNPFTGDKRMTDIDFGCNQQLTFTLTIDLLPTHSIEFMPKSIILRSPDSSFFYKRICSQTGSSVSYTQILEIKRSLFYREDYATVHDFFKRLFGLMAEELVFKEKK